MIEYYVINNAINSLQQTIKAKENYSDSDNTNLTIVYVVVAVLVFTFIIWAIVRALHCSKAAPDSRAVHLLFAVISPVFYVIFSYAVSGFCPK